MKILIAALALSCQAAAASAAVPQFGSKEGDLTCLGLVGLGFRGSIAAKPQDPKMVTTAAVAYSYYIGRLSVAAPTATGADIDAALAKLSTEEKNSFVDTCVKKAAETLTPHLRAPAS